MTLLSCTKVDPDGGSLLNAIEVYCGKEMRKTCINPTKAHYETKSYVTETPKKPEFVAKHMGTEQVGARPD